uniref:Mitochondrial carrier protein n=1 Tax=Chromera velia CCMP2878 TaxID=1169474 RepID=A0A0G4F9G4_9ALVE|mmetsp:Transcript_44429/g.87818  ORF Transcript_44429/g.87818 Transcript_44429/m.87818 type:complete len:524 (-) Transcript_44429:125-1696(-)|eukprot:Cvel_15868.t1-p1 / transcript=Cvel_15868.t1 / gene=Cvel_15868 / organism=Chromera_velia_CCMP2878 / gene_product=Putative mitochondrial carrier protein PET8, putative / transcript_product=Putative mitochondrial carrier protein PET8, putative / location=Cvel_scaffold1196:49067-53391(+) / protein_length=523 / sequence_SO=supercontig / SO=protein_coding / is_pseudo=false
MAPAALSCSLVLSVSFSCLLFHSSSGFEVSVLPSAGPLRRLKRDALVTSEEESSLVSPLLPQAEARSISRLFHVSSPSRSKAEERPPPPHTPDEAHTEAPWRFRESRQSHSDRLTSRRSRLIGSIAGASLALGLGPQIAAAAAGAPGPTAPVELSQGTSSFVGAGAAGVSVGTGVETSAASVVNTAANLNAQAEVLSSSSSLLAAASLPSAATAGGASDEFLSGLLSGAASRIAKEVVLHPIDTVKARLQFREGARVFSPSMLKGLYDGVVPALVVGTPAGSLFFGVKDVASKTALEVLKAKGIEGLTGTQLSTIAGVVAASIPYWAVRQPAELVKTRRQTGVATDSVKAFQEVVEDDGIGGLYQGYGSNFAYAVPTDIVKFLVYDNVKRQWQQAKRQRGEKDKLSTLEGAIGGAAASCVAQIVSTPLDVIRTRLMTSEKKRKGRLTAEEGQGEEEEEEEQREYEGILDCGRKIVEREGAGMLFAGISPRIARAVVSGAIQFSTYELVKNLFGEEAAKKLKKG